jgi:hypothetical protein
MTIHQRKYADFVAPVSIISLKLRPRLGLWTRSLWIEFGELKGFGKQRRKVAVQGKEVKIGKGGESLPASGNGVLLNDCSLGSDSGER